MKQTLGLCVAISSVVLIVGCSLHESSSGERTSVVVAPDEGKTVAIVLTPRSAVWKLADVQLFDVRRNDRY